MNGDEDARITQASVDAIVAYPTNARVTEESIDAMLLNESEGRATQLIAEALLTNSNEGRVTQLIFEVMLSTSAVAPIYAPVGPRLVISATPVTLPPSAPVIQNIAQVGTTLVAYVSPLDVTGEYEVESVALYRAPFVSGPYTLIVAQPLDPYKLINELVDSAPIIGRGSFYVATFFDSQGEQSENSLPYLYSAAVEE